MTSPAPTVIDLIATVAIPSLAIIISSLIAVLIARSERKAAAAARKIEREEVLAGRREARVDDAFVRAVVALATLNTLNLRAETIAEPLREMRVGLTLLVTAHEDGPKMLGEWFEREREAGHACADLSMRRHMTVPDGSPIERFLWASEPLNTWARDFATNLRVWRRGDVSRDELVELAARAKTLSGSARNGA